MPPSTMLVVPTKVESDEERLLCIISLTIGMALKLLRDDVSCLAGNVKHLTTQVEFIKTTDDRGIDPHNYPSDGHDLSTNIPLTINYNTGYTDVNPEYNPDYSANNYGSHNDGNDNAKMKQLEQLEKETGGDRANKPHPYFYHLYTEGTSFWLSLVTQPGV